MHKIVSSANKGHFMSFFAIGMPFIYCSWLIFLDKTSSAMLALSGKNKYLCPVPDLRRKTFSLHYYDRSGLFYRCPLSVLGSSLLLLAFECSSIYFFKK